MSEPNRALLTSEQAELRDKVVERFLEAGFKLNEYYPKKWKNLAISQYGNCYDLAKLTKQKSRFEFSIEISYWFSEKRLEADFFAEFGLDNWVRKLLLGEFEDLHYEGLSESEYGMESLGFYLDPKKTWNNRIVLEKLEDVDPYFALMKRLEEVEERANELLRRENERTGS